MDAEGWREEKEFDKGNCFCGDEHVPRTRRKSQGSAGYCGAIGGWISPGCRKTWEYR